MNSINYFSTRFPNIFYSGNESSGKSENLHETHNEDESQHSSGKYFCPMKCEGDKVYDQPGNCPVCHMKLVPVKE